VGRATGADIPGSKSQRAVTPYARSQSGSADDPTAGVLRAKWLTLPQAYRHFLRECLAPGGVVLSVECELTWPVIRCGERYLFQFGGYGGATIEEYLHGGARVADFLARSGSPWRAWQPPAPDAEQPKAQ
jgi:hypothetical protein